MYISKVQGKCVSTIKNKELNGYSLVTVQRLNKSGTPSGDLIVTVDTIGCSIGETVLVTTGSSARLALGCPNAPVDAVIVGIVDVCDFK
ncbi:MAG: ccmL [Clostridia bacterium]|jgi:microcompartment protein CcmK/EutM|nr:ccmL [Clostridia bacterium]